MLESRTGAQMPDTNTQSGLEQAYLELQRKYHNVVTRGVAGMYRTNLDGCILECNDALAQMLGHTTAEELMQEKALDLYGSKKERDRFLEDLKREGKLINYTIRLRHRSGRVIEALENVYLDRNEDGPSSIMGTIVDVTAFRQAELEQRALTHSYRNLVDHIRDGLMMVHKSRIVYTNPAADQLVGGSAVGLSLKELFSKEDHERVSGLFSATSDPIDQGPIPVHLKGKELMLHAVASIHEGEPAMQLTLQDQGAQQELLRQQLRVRMAEEVNQVLREEIDRHRVTQEELRKSRRFARSLIDSSLDMILAADPAGRISEYNPAAAMRFGWEPEQIMGKESTLLYADPQEFKRVQQELDTHGMFAGEIRNVSCTGEEFTSFLAASRMYDEDGALLGVMGVSRDITQLKRDQEALQASEERYRDLFENATDLIQSVDQEGRFQYVNSAWRSTLGYTAEQVQDLSLADILHPDHRAECMQQFDTVMKGAESRIIRTVFVGRDGQEIAVEGSTNLSRKAGRTLAMRSIFRDVTNVQAARRQVQQHEAKMRALFESSDHMFWTVDPGIKLTSYNRGYAAMIQRLHGVEPEINTDPKKPRKRFAESAYHDFWEAKYKEAFEGRTTRFETERNDVNGQRVCNEIFLSPVFGPEGQVIEV
ncbi:MAG: PAS domain S-box protein, partial [Flavobacteriales bacterium]